MPIERSQTREVVFLRQQFRLERLLSTLSARIGQVLLDEFTQAQSFIQLAHQNQAALGDWRAPRCPSDHR